MKIALEILLVLSSIIMMILVLMHRGKGGGLSSLFGGGMQSSLSGSSVVERNLDIYTVGVGLFWLALVLVYGLGVSFQWF